MGNILLVEDDSVLGAAIEFSLKKEGFEVTRASTVTEAKQYFQQHPFDLAILDIGLPDGNGYDLCQYLKEQKNDVPVIFLSALDEEVNVVMGLEIGGNDYITKPFRVKEMISRVKVQLRKKTLSPVAETVLSSESITLEINESRAYKNDQKLVLTNLEYKLLYTFMTNAQTTLKRDTLLASITSSDEVFFDENTLSVYIKRLREKIEDQPQHPQFIITQRGLGYRWDKEVRKQ